jgi:GNAT superfamily N-acetyltransferase
MAAETEPTILRVTPDQFSVCYALLAETFQAEELNSRQELLADLAKSATDEPAEKFVMLARMARGTDPNGPCQAAISLIVGCYLALDAGPFAGQSVGFIEYLVTHAEFRQQGHASAMLTAFEQDMLRMADFRDERLRLILGEIDPDLVAFKQKRGYRQPLDSRYLQPPIAFDAQTGRPVSSTLPKVLVVKSWNQPVAAGLLLHAVQRVFEKRYVPHNIGAPAGQQVAAYIHAHVYAPFAASLRLDEGFVKMA